MIYSFTRWGYSLAIHPRELPTYTAFLEEISNEKINVKENVVTIIKKIEYPE
jgi:hypothetical protein